MSSFLLSSTLLLLLLPLLLLPFVVSADDSNATSKRGLIFIPNADTPQDDSLWTKSGTDLTWYYNYNEIPSDAPLPSTTVPATGTTLEFVPMMWGLRNGDPSDTSFLANVQELLSHPGWAGPVTYALAFNEPDGPLATGGSAMDTMSAARAWVANFEPLRAMGIKVGLPAVTGADEGMAWLQQFLADCKTVLSAQVGGEKECAFDFVPVHWYDDSVSLKVHVESRIAAFPGKDIWVTEFAFANRDLAATQDYFHAATTYLDTVPQVARYSYFGAFRSSVSNVGPAAAFLNADGQLTDVGSWYLGFGDTGVVPSAAVRMCMSVWGVVVVFFALGAFVVL